MAFIHRSGGIKVDWFPKKASTAIANNAALTFDGSGAVTIAVAASTRIAGLNIKTIASGDSDYASTTKVPVIVPSTDAIFEADVITGTLTTAMVGNQYDLASSLGVDVTATAHKQVTVVGFISASKALVRFTGAYLFANAV